MWVWAGRSIGEGRRGRVVPCYFLVTEEAAGLARLLTHIPLSSLAPQHTPNPMGRPIQSDGHGSTAIVGPDPTLIRAARPRANTWGEEVCVCVCV